MTKYECRLKQGAQNSLKFLYGCRLIAYEVKPGML